MVAATGIPFLRFKRPQSPYLGRIIRDKMTQKKRRFDHVTHMDEMIKMAFSENQFDRLLLAEARNEATMGEKGREMRSWLRENEQLFKENWATDMIGVRDEVLRVTMTELEKGVERSRRLLAIMDKDGELLEKERKEKKQEKKDAYLARKRIAEAEAGYNK